MHTSHLNNVCLCKSPSFWWLFSLRRFDRPFFRPAIPSLGKTSQKASGRTNAPLRRCGRHAASSIHEAIAQLILSWLENERSEQNVKMHYSCLCTCSASNSRAYARVFVSSRLCTWLLHRRSRLCTYYVANTLSAALRLNDEKGETPYTLPTGSPCESKEIRLPIHQYGCGEFAN